MIKRITSPLLEQYRGLVSEELLTEIYELANLLRNVQVLHLNTTRNGGGVAGLLSNLIPLTEELGIRNCWEIVQLNEFSCRLMAKLTDMLQGKVPGDVTTEEHIAFLANLTQAMRPLQEKHADIYCVHDIQLAPLALQFPGLRPALWFCHIDTAQPNPHAEQYIRQFLDAYILCVFVTPFSVFKSIQPGHSEVMTPGINPFASLNKPLAKERGHQLLSRCGIDIRRPLIVQVSRFGRWKNPWQVIEIYRLVKHDFPDAQVALVGAMEAIDDVKAQEIFADVQRMTAGEPDIHLLTNPQLIDHEVVNAFQRYAQIILQRSNHEGFGLTITEAMWKGQPVIGTSATGSRYQIQHGRTGYIVDETSQCAEYAIKLLQDHDLHTQLGKEAHKYVKEHFLLPMMVRDFLKELILALSRE